jgi:5-(carboxyamino)imidazole ribonucleotide synthase
MMILAGAPMGLQFGVVSPNPDDPAAGLADVHVRGAITDGDAIARLAEWADVLTVEIEHVNVDALAQAEDHGLPVRPSGAVLRAINDKLGQKSLLADAGIPVPRYSEELSGFPIVQKSRFGGYDGRGVVVLTDDKQPRLEGQTFYEEPISIRRELAVIVWRAPSGDVGHYPTFEMHFDERANICTHVCYPTEIDPRLEADAAQISLASVEAIGAVGVVAVELFLDTNDRLLVNELAPRPHNSGHLTIDAFETSQFEQHLRVITGRRPGSVRAHSAAAMLNLLGHPRASGPAGAETVASLLETSGSHLHWYGKNLVKPFRKMGHLTLTAQEPGEVKRRLESVAESLWVYSDGEGR